MVAETQARDIDRNKKAMLVIRGVGVQIDEIERRIETTVTKIAFNDVTRAQELSDLATEIRQIEASAKDDLLKQSDSLSGVDKGGLRKDVAGKLEEAVIRVNTVQEKSLKILENKRLELEKLARERASKDQSMMDLIKAFDQNVKQFEANIGAQVKAIEEIQQRPEQTKEQLEKAGKACRYAR